MSTRWLFTAGLGYSPGITYWLFTRGLTTAGGPPFPPTPVFSEGGMWDMTITAALALQQLLVLLDVATAYDDCTVHLIKVDFIPAANDVIATYTEADYTGYAALPLGAFAGAFANGNGDLVAEFPHNVFSPTGTAVSNTIFGWWIQGPLGGGSDQLINVRKLDVPVVLNSPLTALVAEPRIPLGQPRGD